MEAEEAVVVVGLPLLALALALLVLHRQANYQRARHSLLMGSQSCSNGRWEYLPGKSPVRLGSDTATPCHHPTTKAFIRVVRRQERGLSTII